MRGRGGSRGRPAKRKTEERPALDSDGGGIVDESTSKEIEGGGPCKVSKSVQVASTKTPAAPVQVASTKAPAALVRVASSRGAYRSQLDVPFGASLILSFIGEGEDATAAILDDFLSTTIKFGDEDTKQGLLMLSEQMKEAVNAYATVYNDFNVASARLQQVCNEKATIERTYGGVFAENSHLKGVVGALEAEIQTLRKSVNEASTVVTENIQLKAKALSLERELGVARKSLNKAAATVSENEDELRSHEAVIADLRKKLATSQAETAAALLEFGEHKEVFESDKSELYVRIESLKTRLDEAQKQADLYLSSINRYTDPITGMQHRCPVIQNNGVIRSLQAVIEIWASESDMGQCNAFRMFSCPVTKNYSMISPFPIVDTVMKLACSAGVDVSSPLVFMYKEGSWIEFSFHDQLELVARLCSVYRDRKDKMKPPEQWSASIPGGGSVLILMRAAVQGDKFRLGCFGVRNDRQVEIKVVFDPDWGHPFCDMDFPSGL